MKIVNKTGYPFAHKEKDEDGFWYVYFSPKKKLNGYYYYSALRGAIDEQDAEAIVKLLNNFKVIFDPVQATEV